MLLHVPLREESESSIANAPPARCASYPPTTTTRRKWKGRRRLSHPSARGTYGVHTYYATSGTLFIRSTAGVHTEYLLCYVWVALAQPKSTVTGSWAHVIKTEAGAVKVSPSDIILRATHALMERCTSSTSQFPVCCTNPNPRGDHVGGRRKEGGTARERERRPDRTRPTVRGEGRRRRRTARVPV